MSLDKLDPNGLAAVVTYLEMTERPNVDVPASALRIERRRPIDCDRYRRLFRAVGAPWLWFSRLAMADSELRTIIDDPKLELFAVVDASGAEVGMLELDFREEEACELSFLGLVPALAGKGHGRWLLAEALDRAWRPGIYRVHVHTCTLDHPAALAAYRRAGFVVIGRAVERFIDPRVAGVLPPDCAPQVALLGTLADTARRA